MLAESTDDKPLQERYDMLKALCRQQILVNETLKFEISKLRNLVRKVSAERTLLLDELLENHSSCRLSSEVDSKVNASRIKANIQVSEKRPHSQDDRHFTDAKKSKPGNLWNEENSDGREDFLGTNLEIEDTIHHELSHLSAKGRLPYQLNQQQTSPNVNKSTSSLINPTEEKPRHFMSNSSSWHSSNLSGSNSPPTVTSNSRLSQSPNQSYEPIPQKTSKLGSLVTNSSVSNVSSAPFNFPQRNTALNQTKYVSVGNRSVKVIGSGVPNTVGRDQPTGGMLKTAISPPISPNIRLSTSSVSNQRIMIQPNKGTVRSIIVPRTQHNISDAPLKYGYTG